MTNTAAELLAGLREDHRNMATLLRMLAAQAELIGEGKQPDLSLMRDVMRYMIVYSDAIHHPKEDLMYAGLHALDPSFAAGLEKVEAEHEEIAGLSQRLQDDIETAIAGAAIDTARVVGDAAAYTQRLQQHMAWEETDLFMRAEAAIDRIAIDTSHLMAIDPVFGEKHDDAFADLRRSVTQDTRSD